jgi:hypothetical protein
MERAQHFIARGTLLKSRNRVDRVRSQGALQTRRTDRKVYVTSRKVTETKIALGNHTHLQKKKGKEKKKVFFWFF